MSHHPLHVAPLLDSEIVRDIIYNIHMSAGSYCPDQVIAGRYRILAFLGGGESSEVYKVSDLVNGRVAALKIL
ncbi:MAG: hypothetical protein ABIK43_02760, partial [candidate division WOR-3 bacterium]